MKLRFVVDDCVLLHALEGVDRHGEPDDSSGFFLALLFYNCHAIVICDEIQASFYSAISQGSSLSRAGRLLHPKVLEILKQFLSTGDKTQWVDPHDVVIEDTFPKEDLYLVKAAYASHSDITTSDQELLDDVKKSAQFQKAGITARTPSEAISLVSAL